MMRSQVTVQQPAPLSNLDILLKILLPAFFIRPTLSDFSQSIFNSKSLMDTDCPLRQFKCKNERCVQRVWMCDGTDDCGDNSDETDPQCSVKLYSCTKDEFTCTNGFCIPKGFYCDREKDCPDGSDEGPEVCGVGKCEENEIECEPGHCIDPSWACDGKVDCKNGKDELDCNKTCNINEFTCGTGECILKSWVCDGDSDCDDGSDERNCTIRQCPAADFQCTDKSCITKKWRCDGDFDCPDHSDEKNCSNVLPEHSMCSPSEFSCPDRIHCIKSFKLCDGIPNCPDGGDESNDICGHSTCSKSQFRCRNYQCIEGLKRCDGERDCSDGSDEENCSNVESCKKNEFYCGEGICIPIRKVCNRHRDCPYGEDEPRGKCGVNECLVNNGGCSDICVNTLTGHYCDCHPGYKLSNNSMCIDINECENPSSCSQICVNKKGSFSCECLNGYTIDPNDFTHCLANYSEPAILIFSKRNDIRQISLDGKNMSTIVNTNVSSALDFFFNEELIFWSDTVDKKIYKAPIKNGNSRSVVISNTSLCEGLAVDWIYRNIYWTDTGKKSIQMSNFDGSIIKTLISDRLGEPRAIVVNPLDGWMYWSDWGYEGRIERAGMDGSNRRRIVSYDVKWPNGLTLDLVRNRLFWVDAKSNMISSVNFDGSGRRMVLRDESTLHHPFSISVFEDLVYWTDWDKQTIFKANKNNGSNVTTLTEARMLQSPMVVHVYHPYKQPEGLNLCEKTKCSHLCVPTPNINSYSPAVTCACPDNLLLLSNRLTCSDKATLFNPEIIFEETTSMVDVAVIIDNDQDPGYGMTIYVIVGLVALFFAIPLCCYTAYRYYRGKSINRITFDCPAYIKPSDENDLLQGKKPFNNTLICSYDEEAQEPLRRPGTNSFI